MQKHDSYEQQIYTMCLPGRNTNHGKKKSCSTCEMTTIYVNKTRIVDETYSITQIKQLLSWIDSL